jgi:hypothetical protein
MMPTETKKATATSHSAYITHSIARTFSLELEALHMEEEDIGDIRAIVFLSSS